MPVEDRLERRGLDPAPFQPQDDAIEHHQLVFGPAQPALDPPKPALARVGPLANLENSTNRNRQSSVVANRNQRTIPAVIQDLRWSAGTVGAHRRRAAGQSFR